MQPRDFLKQVMTDTKVKLSEEFDSNFERKAFFDKRWRQALHKVLLIGQICRITPKDIGYSTEQPETKR